MSGTDPSSFLSFHDNLRHHASVRPDKPAVVYEGTTLTFAQLHEQARRIAQGLHKHGLRAGDKVGIYLRNHGSYIPIYYGLSMAGLVAVPINYMLRSQQLGTLLKLTDCK